MILIENDVPRSKGLSEKEEVPVIKVEDFLEYTYNDLNNKLRKLLLTQI